MKELQTGEIASIRQRLLNISRDRKADFQLILTQYVIERILYRISRSPYRNQLILKGAQLFRAWSGDDFRPTRDLDLLGSGDSSPERIHKIFKTVCDDDTYQDGLVLDTDSIIVSNIRDDQAYSGQRVKFISLLGRAKIDVQIDIGFGDIITPEPMDIEYPTFLDMPQPVVLSYTPETVIAEKFEAMIDLGFQNSRMKDFFDIWVLLKNFEFTGNRLASAIRRTFDRRQTKIPTSEPLAFTVEFSEDRQKVIQWGAFLRKNKLTKKIGTLTEKVRKVESGLGMKADAGSTDAANRAIPAVARTTARRKIKMTVKRFIIRYTLRFDGRKQGLRIPLNHKSYILDYKFPNISSTNAAVSSIEPLLSIT